jgi:hypothetical protein
MIMPFYDKECSTCVHCNGDHFDYNGIGMTGCKKLRFEVVDGVSGDASICTWYQCFKRSPEPCVSEGGD